jgi:NAD(P)-dependent dehydrogenase (short-subunit alcohol dehydrogenase family)
MAARPWSARKVVVLGGTGGLRKAVVDRFRGDGASVLVADARLPAGADRREDLDYVAVDALDEASVSAALGMTPVPAAVVNLIGGGAGRYAGGGSAVRARRSPGER